MKKLKKRYVVGTGYPYLNVQQDHLCLYSKRLEDQDIMDVSKPVKLKIGNSGYINDEKYRLVLESIGE